MKGSKVSPFVLLVAIFFMLSLIAIKFPVVVRRSFWIRMVIED